MVIPITRPVIALSRWINQANGSYCSKSSPLSNIQLYLRFYGDLIAFDESTGSYSITLDEVCSYARKHSFIGVHDKAFVL